MVDLVNYFKKNFQFQACFVDNNSVSIKRKEVLKLLDEKKTVDNINYGYSSEEQFEVISPACFNKRLILFFNELMDREVYSICIEHQLLEVRNSELISYHISHNRIHKIGSVFFSSDKIKGIFEEHRYIYISFVDLNLLSALGRNAMFESLKEAGEIRAILKQNLIVSELSINYNVLAHYAKLNINRIVVLDAVGVNL
jgi:hypothetical protein